MKIEMELTKEKYRYRINLINPVGAVYGEDIKEVFMNLRKL